ncbi:phenylacetate--CoA ligase family protein, partial [Brevibacillus choshinensis]
HIIQHEPQSLSIKLVKEPGRFRSADEDRLLAGIRTVLGEVSVQVAYVDQIAPTGSGKLRYAIRECPLTSAQPME